MALRDARSVSQRIGSSLAIATLVAACGGGGGDDYSGGGGGGGGGGIPGLQPTFASIQANVFTPICTACHTGASAPQGLRLEAANSYGLLVGVASTEQPGIQRVKPSDPANSYLIQKLEGTAATGGRMPLGGTPLTAGDIAMIRQWITDGAQNAPGSNSPVRVTSLSVVPGSSATSLPASITAMFSRELNASTATVATFLLDRSGGDGTFSDGNEVTVAPASITVPGANPSTAVMSLNGVASVNDTYRVRLLGSGAAVIQDLGGNALDGEFSGTFPAGNGTAGGDFVATFTIGAAAPTLATLQANVFGPRCSGCHNGSTPGTLPGAMDLRSAGSTAASFIGVASLEVPALQRVKAGDSANSYVVQKVSGTAAVGGQMPLGGAALDAATINSIKAWIDAGANP